jgi:tRNA(fMet)-specific endonuclease VapC
MAAVIDSCVLIDIERGRFRLEDLDRFGPSVVVSAITIGELAMGIELMQSAAKRARAANFLDTVTRTLPCIAIDERIARTFGQIASDLRRRGMPIGAHDTWIAATAIAHDHTMVTDNVKHFECVDGLSIQRWTPEL